MRYDYTSTKLRDENDKLTKERNITQAKLQKLHREKEEYSRNWNTEQCLAREELQKKEKETTELVSLLKDRDSRKSQRLETEIENLKAR